MHHIQRKILSKLLYAETLSYSHMRPDGVESNHFAYHLEQLMKDGFVVKQDKQYCLSPLGLAHVDRMSHEKMVDRQQPHILTVVSVTNDQGQTLLFRRTFQPYINRYGFPMGKIHMDETIEQAAIRELQEKTGLTDVPLAHRGIVYVDIKQGGFRITKALCHIFSGRVRGEPALPSLMLRGSCEWADITTLQLETTIPGFLEIAELLAQKTDDFFFTEYSIEMSSS